MNEVYVIGVGMTPFAKHWNRSLRSLATEATTGALDDAGVSASEVAYTFFSNAVGGVVTGQETIRGQVALRDSGLLGSSIFNVENACASGSSAAHLAWMTVASGQSEYALAVGAEKLTHTDKSVSFRAFASGVDLDEVAGEDYNQDRLAIAVGDGSHSRFMDIYAENARVFMQRTGITQEDLARVVVKSREFGALNERAQFRERLTIEEVLGAREISYPLTLPMCSPIGDGAAALVFGTKAAAIAAGGPLVRVRATSITSGTPMGGSSLAPTVARIYEAASISGADLDVIEVHDAAAPAEIEFYESLQLAEAADLGRFVASGAASLGGTQYVNSSGGLLAKGHPVGASGCAQIVELTEQLKGRAGARQHPRARLGLAVNAGGSIGDDSAAIGVTVLEGVKND
ncbi:thiolase family protein [Pseudarthrobacter sulfonivorans]|uniref:thiolase family protein n=1 Tax=Pseudarthrobacter sulfonivorans TaxID=121292 RepID=UPI002107C694|nr:thiolase family protein [Pseudarthrobacter sulfonivorans]